MCVFCEKEINRDLILIETDYSLLIANKFPLGNSNLMAIPKRHVESITELDSNEIKDIMDLIVFATSKIESSFKPEGFNIFINQGLIAGQTISHLHIHIVPRSEKDGLENFKRNGEKKEITEKELEELKRIF